MPDPEDHFDDFAAVIGLWPTLADYAEDVGIDYNLAKQHRRRNSIPPDRWERTIQAAQRRGYTGVTAGALVTLAAKAKRADAA